MKISGDEFANLVIKNIKDQNNKNQNNGKEKYIKKSIDKTILVKVIKQITNDNYILESDGPNRQFIQTITATIMNTQNWENLSNSEREALLNSHVATLILEEPHLKKKQNPVAIIRDNSIKVRRMDSLARLLAVDEKITACLAVAIVNDQLIISVNEPHNGDRKQVFQHIDNKLKIIQNFLMSLDVKEEDNNYNKQITTQFSSAAKKKAFEVAMELGEHGGIANVVPKSEARKRKSKTLNIGTKYTHTQSSLLKLASSYLKSKLSNEKQGEFNLKEINALLSNDYIFLPSKDNDPTVNKSQELHSEQAILAYLKENQIHDPIVIGLSKLSCKACDSVFSHLNHSYRGTHGIPYPNVNVLGDNGIKKYEYEETIRDMKSEDQSPFDSDSEVEFEESRLDQSDLIDLPRTNDSEIADVEHLLDFVGVKPNNSGDELMEYAIKENVLVQQEINEKPDVHRNRNSFFNQAVSMIEDNEKNRYKITVGVK